MKRLLLATTLAVFSMSSFAQIDDVVNKPKAKQGRQNDSISGEVLKTVFNRIQEIELTNLVDEMKRDGVTERKYAAVLGLGGRILDVNIYMDDQNTKSKILPFIVKLSSDKKVYFSVAGLDLGNIFENSVEKGGFNSREFLPFSKVQFAVFQIDEGLNFRDVKTTSFDFFDAEAKLPILAKGRNQYLAFVLGSKLGFANEDIILDNGQKIQLRGRPYESDDKGHGLGFRFGAQGGIELRDNLGFGIMTVKGIAHYETISLRDGNSTMEKEHVKFGVTPSVSLTRSVGKKMSLTLGAGMNMMFIDKLSDRVDNGDSYSAGYKSINSIDLRDRNRQPFNASLKLKF